VWQLCLKFVLSVTLCSEFVLSVTLCSEFVLSVALCSTFVLSVATMFEIGMCRNGGNVVAEWGN
jgi:hypothetical protein